MRMPRPGWRTALLLVSALSFSCIESAGTHGSRPGEEYDAGWESFRTQVVESSAVPGVFIVEGDIAIRGEEALRRYYRESVAHVSQPLTVRLTAAGNDDVWSASIKHSLTYCIGDGFGTRKATVIAAMAAAAESWSRRVGVTFRYVPSEDSECILESPDVNLDVVFDVRPAPATETYNAAAFFPSDSRLAKKLSIHSRAFGTMTGGRTLEGVLGHELGHVLGFRHEHMWATPTPTCLNPDAGMDLYSPGHADDSRLLYGEYDAVSIMHYVQCRPVGAVDGYAQTEKDYRGAISIYGLAPALIVSAL